MTIRASAEVISSDESFVQPFVPLKNGVTSNQIIGLQTAKDFVHFSFPQHDVCRDILVCVIVVVFLCTIIWCSGDSYILK